MASRHLMTILKSLTIFLCLALLSCGHAAKPHTRHQTDPKAEELYRQVMPLVNYTDDPDTCSKAIALLDSATSIDDSCFSCYFNKLMFLSSLRQPDKIRSTYQNLIRLEPQNARLYLWRGYFYEINGRQYFRQKRLSNLG
jgi:hypothetical protein